MKFFKDNSYSIVRLYINQIGITIFSFMLYSAAGIVGDTDTGKLINVFISIFATVFYLVLIYVAGWDFGAKDKLHVDAGRMEHNKYKGALMAVFANLPNLIFAIVCFIAYGVYLLGAPGFFNGLFTVFNLLLRFTMAMYTGILVGILDGQILLQTVGFLICPVFSIGAAHLGYTMGIANRHILDVFKSNTDK